MSEDIDPSAYAKSTLRNTDRAKPRQLKVYLNWVEKQANQQQKTLELEGVTHSRARKEQLKASKKIYEEEAKRVRDLLEDGK